MSLCFAGPRGEVEQRWIFYALLLDNIQHHIEGGRPTGEFQEIHKASQALGGGPVKLSALRLHAELEKAQASLAGRSISELAISGRTRAVIDGRWPPLDPESTALVGAGSEQISWLHPQTGTLDDAFGNLIRRLLAITADARETDWVEVSDV